MTGNSLVRVKCKACGFEWEQRRLPRRCANCRAYLAVVGCEILSRTTGKAAPKQLKEAKEPKIEPEVEEKPVKPEVKPETKPNLPKTPTPTPKTFELNAPTKATLTEMRRKVEDYNCGNCNAKITKGMEKCPECGVELNWGDIHE
ncbi:MAG: hypothetical protein HWN68_13930 [Desulfobacterales bacterium]|nr:hypothetical protein [Desulfobacterales bacterium]